MSPTELLERIKPGVCATLWTPRAMSETLTPQVRHMLIETKPQIVCLHGTPESLQLEGAGVWKHLQAMGFDRLWIGVSCDASIRRAALGKSTNAAVADLEGAAETASRLGAELVMWDAEAACVLAPKIAGVIAQELIACTRQNYPEIVQGHTSYGRPTVQAYYPWRAWYGEDGVDVALPEHYAAPEQPTTGPRLIASPGALRTRMRRDIESWEQAVGLGWIRRDLVHWPYVQLHHVPFVQTATYATDPQKIYKPMPEAALGHVWAGWCVEKDRCDADGLMALKIGAELHRRAQSVEQFQREAGIQIDGIAGPETARALFPDHSATPTAAQ